MRLVIAIVLGLALVGQSTPTWGGSSSGSSTAEQAAYGAGSALGTLVYVPFKASFCILGGIGSAFTAIVSTSTARKVATASCGGTWVITPAVVQGQDTVHFIGEAPRDRGAAR